MTSKMSSDEAMLTAKSKSSSSGGTGRMSSSTVPNTPTTNQRSIWLRRTNQLSFVFVIASVSGPTKSNSRSKLILCRFYWVLLSFRLQIRQTLPVH